MVPGDELIEQLAGSYSEVGLDETMVVTRSNKRANVYNNGIRGMVLGREDELTPGDMLMIVRNNYFWVEQEEKKAREAAKSSEPAPKPPTADMDEDRPSSFIAQRRQGEGAPRTQHQRIVWFPLRRPRP